MVAFLKGKTSITGKFWLVNLLKFGDGGAEEYQKYVDALLPLLHHVGGRPVYKSFIATTVVDGGLLPDWDGVFIGSIN